MARAYKRRDWSKLDPLIDNLQAQGRNPTEIARDLRINRQTLEAHLKSRKSAGTPIEHPGTPERSDLTETVVKSYAEHLSTPEPTEILSDEQYTQEPLSTFADADPTEVHHGTLEGHQEVMEDISQSVPDAPHIGIDETDQSTPEHPSTPEVHQELSVGDSSMEHFGVPARQDHLISTPMVHPGTPSEEDWELWNTIKSMWPRVEKMLSDQQVLLSTPMGTPRQTQKKTYVFDVEHIALIDTYARVHRMELKDVIYLMCEEFFQRR
jgi:hypothetical protein